MAIKAIFPDGTDAITVSQKLHQWDYGQTLEIEARDLPSIVEVHFACYGMAEAEVRPCSVVDNIATVAIPDKCLEQASSIHAWVFEIVGNQGMTTKAITIPIVARARPNKSDAIPEVFADCYTQLITEVNEAVASLRAGDVTVNYAYSAGQADTAKRAESAATAVTANTAGSKHGGRTRCRRFVCNNGDSVWGIILYNNCCGNLYMARCSHGYR